jgi:hypothetical protein
VRLLLLVALVAAATGTACQLPGSCTAQIDWVNFVQVGDTQYVADPDLQEVADTDLGPAFAEVKFKVDGNVCDPSYRPKDGDAAFLDKGTAIYLVRGYPAGDRLAARFNGKLVLYRPLRPAQES